MPFITAHSGCEDTPDNTLENIEKAIELDVEYIELDVRATKDGIAVLNHDDRIGDITISQSTFDDLKAYNIVAYEEAVRRIIKAGKKVNSDIKCLSAVDPVATYILNQGIIDKVILTGCEEKEVCYLTKNYPMIKKLLNANYLLENDDLNYDDRLSSLTSICKKNNVLGINISYQLVNEQLLKSMKENDIDIYVWTINNEETMRDFIDKEIKSITTREVILLQKIMQSNKKQEVENEKI